MLARQALLAFLTNILGALAGAVALFAASHYMSTTAMGMFAFTLSLALLATTFANLGFDKAHMKRLSEGRHPAALLATYGTIKAALTLVVVAGGVMAAVIWSRREGFHDAATLRVVAAGFAYVLVRQWRDFWMVTFQGFRWTAASQALALVEHAVRAPAFVVVALVFGAASGRWVPLAPIVSDTASWIREHFPVTDEMGAIALMLAQVAAILAGIPIAMILARRRGLGIGRPTSGLLRSYAGFAWPLTLLSILTVAASQIDSVMVGYFWSATDVAHYYGGQRLAHFAAAIPSAVAILFFPMISELTATGQTRAVHDLARTAQRYMGMIMVPLAMFMIVYSQEGARIALGPSYEASGPIVAVLGAQVLLLGFMAISNNLLAGLDRPRTLAKVGATFAASNVLLNVLFIPSSLLGVPFLGLRGLGAAVATLLAQAIGLGVSLLASRRAIGAFVVPADWWKQAIAAIATGLALWLTKPFLLGGVTRIWELLASGVLGVALYTGLLILLRGFTKRDLLFFYDLVHPGKMGAYVRSELFHED